MSKLIESLYDRCAYPHEVSAIKSLETHISWVVLTGPYAYKIKKPVKLKFLDFSTLERRKHFCEEEIRLNRRWSSGLYLGVVEIRGSIERPVIDGGGELLDYAVKMRQFPQSALLDAQLDAGMLDDSDMKSLAEMLAAQHAKGEKCHSDDLSEGVGSLRKEIQNNFDSISNVCDPSAFGPLRHWSQTEFEQLREILLDRQSQGFVRECHGDLHLGNLVRLEQGIRAFDCVEFSADLRNIDVISDVAFLVMDLFARHRKDLAYQFLNRYLEISGDYNGLLLLDLYVVYHCMIRAKVAAIRSSERKDEQDTSFDLKSIEEYRVVAEDWINRSLPCLIIMHGFSGSGKTTVSNELIGIVPAVRVRSDVERKRMHGLSEFDDSASSVDRGMYSKDSSRNVYERLGKVAARILESGRSVIVDASFLSIAHRRQFSELAEQLHCPFLMVDTHADKFSLKNRLNARQTNRTDPSEADLNVLNHQFQMSDPLTDREKTTTLSISTNTPVDPESLAQDIGRLRKQINADRAFSIEAL